MATAPAVAYLGDTNQYIDWCNKWGSPYFHRVATFENGPLGEKCQRNISGLTDGFDSNASQSTYSNEVLFQGRQVCKMHCPAGGTGSLAFGGTFETDVGARRGQEMWSQATLYLPSSGWDLEEVMAGGGGWKLMRNVLKSDFTNNFHADIYFNAVGRSADKPFYFALEAQTDSSQGHSPHNSITNAGDRSVWDVPRDQWFDVQYYVRHDTGHNGDPRTKIMCWVGDTLIDEFEATPTSNRHSMTNDTDRVFATHLCTYINAKYNPGQPDHGVTKPQTWYCAAYEVTNKRPTHTDVAGNPKLPPRVI